MYKLFTISVVQAQELQEKAIAQQTGDMLIAPMRGVIYDTTMKQLAISVLVETVYVSPADIASKCEAAKNQSDPAQKQNAIDAECEKIARALADICEADYDTLYKLTQKKYKNAKGEDQYSRSEIVARRIEKEPADKVREYIEENDYKAQIYLKNDSKRFYPYNDLAASVIGFCDIDNNGQYGVERYFNDVLNGIPGRVVTAKDGLGTVLPFEYEQFFDPENGNGIVLTIDMTMQKMLEKRMEEAFVDNKPKNGVSGIIMNVKTGEILAMGSYPSVNLNNPRTVSDEMQAYFDGMSENDKPKDIATKISEQVRNKIVSEPYEPGSVFKILTSSMAIEEKKVNDNETFNCQGFRVVAGIRISCWRPQGHGTETFVQGVHNSCNPVFIDVGQRIGADTFQNYLSLFGLDKKTGIQVPSEANSLLIPKDKFNIVELSVSAFGQTFKVTPIQLMAAECGVLNGGNMMEPHIVKAITDANGNIISEIQPKVVRQVVSEETSKKMAEILAGVVETGTGKNANIRGYRVGGKTGTSEKRDSLDKGARIASFFGVAPCDDPEIACLILIDEPTGESKQGGVIASPVVRRVFEDVLPYYGIKPVYTSEELQSMDIPVPDCIGYNKEDTDYLIKRNNLKVKFVGYGEKVTAQIPVPGARISGESEIIIYMGEAPEEKEVIVPYVGGLDFEQATKALKNAGLFLQVSGAIVFNPNAPFTSGRQDPPYGTTVKYGSVVKVEFNDTVTTVDETDVWS